MKDTTHTPGPWLLYEDSEPIVQAYDPRINEKVDIAHLDASELYDEQVRANARLIAAAPELLEALRNLVDRGIVADDNDHYDECVAAIAKAEGGEA